MSKLKGSNAKMTNHRWTICFMLFMATIINYLDRQVLSSPGPILSPLSFID